MPDVMIARILIAALLTMGCNVSSVVRDESALFFEIAERQAVRIVMREACGWMADQGDWWQLAHISICGEVS